MSRITDKLLSSISTAREDTDIKLFQMEFFAVDMSPQLLFLTRKENIEIYVAKSSLPSLAILQLLSSPMAKLLMVFTFYELQTCLLMSVWERIALEWTYITKCDQRILPQHMLHLVMNSIPVFRQLAFVYSSSVAWGLLMTVTINFLYSYLFRI